MAGDAMSDMCPCGYPIDDCASLPGLRHCPVAVATYTPDQQRVAEWWSSHGIGGGVDPIGSMIASHEAMARQRNQLRSGLQNLLDGEPKWGLRYKHIKRLLNEVV